MPLAALLRNLALWLWLLALVCGAEEGLYVRHDSFWETGTASRARLQAHWQETGFQPLIHGLLRKGNPPRAIAVEVAGVDQLVLVAQHPVKDRWLPVVWGEARLTKADGTVVPLASLVPEKVAARPGGFTRYDGKPVSLGDTKFAHGIAALAPVEVRYRLAGAYQKFEATIGVSPTTEETFSVRFKVLDVPDAEEQCEQVWQQIAADFPDHTREFSVDGPYWLASPGPQWLEGRLFDRVVKELGECGAGLTAKAAELAKEKPAAYDPRRLALLDQAVRYKLALAAIGQVDPAMTRALTARLPGDQDPVLARLAVVSAKVAAIRTGLAATDETVLASLPGTVATGRALLGEVLAGVLGTDEILFAVRDEGRDGHWYANFGYWCSDPDRKVYAPGGSRLAKLNLRTGTVTDILVDPDGAFRDPQVSYDASKFLFCYRKGGTEHYKLHEANIDGSGVRQLLSDPSDDIEPTYLPDGDIVFCSSRCNRWVNCWFTPVATLYRCGPHGENVRPVSANVEHDNTPWPLPDGRLLYTRWEYVDRSQMAFHHLWTINPDGTGQMVYYGNQEPGRVFIDAKPIPGTDRIVASFCPGHGRREHAGAITVVSPKRGPDDPAAERCLNPNPIFRDPYPLAEDLFLVACENRLLLMDGQGATQELYRAEKFIHEPRPIRPRPREHVIPDRTNPASPDGQLVLEDVYAGRNMAGVERGTIKQLLVLESLPKPVNHSGGMDMLSDIGTFTLERVLGTVPVAPDGSAHFRLPANRPVFFVALDQDGLSVKRMQSFVSVLPGETTSCLGCHEPRTRAPALPGRPAVQAASRPPDPVLPFAGVPDVIDFPTHVQPILDAHCVKCHNYETRSGGVVLVGDYGARRGTKRFMQSYWTLLLRRQINDGNNHYGNLPPHTIGSGASPLIAKIRQGHHGVALSETEYRTVWNWVETGTPFAGTYASLLVTTGPTTGGGASQVIAKRCVSCHNQPGRKLPTDLYGVKPHYYRVIPEGAERYAYPLLYNESHPEQSLALLAPLAKEAGGYGICPGPVFKDTSDPDYQKMLAALRPPGEYLQTAVLYHMPGFRPNEHYLREMKRCGVLPATFAEATDPIDVFATDQAYWRTFWYHPTP